MSVMRVCIHFARSQIQGWSIYPGNSAAAAGTLLAFFLSREFDSRVHWVGLRNPNPNFILWEALYSATTETARVNEFS